MHSRVSLGPSAALVPKFGVLFGLLSLLLPLPVLAGTFTAFGPQNYIRGTADPVTVTNSFTALNPNTTYTLQIHNGGLVDGQFKRVSSAVFMLNGVQIVGPNKFNQNVTVIQKPVTLSSANQLSVQLQAQPGGGLTVQIIGIDNDPPIITALASPLPNAAGWNNTNVTVTFTCSDATSGIASCPAPVTVTTEGAGQIISWTATDLAGNTASASVTINLDKTPPSVAISSPPDGATLTTSPVTVTGTLSDPLSGVASVTCNGAPASFTTTTFTCNLALISGPNPIDVEVTDRAGNTATTQLRVVYSPLSPLTITEIRPNTGDTGTELFIHGTGFGTDLTHTQVLVAGVPATVVRSLTDTAIDVLVPPIDSSGPVQVVVDSTASNSVPFTRLEFPFTPMDSSKIVTTPTGETFPLDEVLVDLNPGEGLATAQALAGAVTGHIINFIAPSNTYTFKLDLPPSSPDELEGVLTLLEQDPRVFGVSRNLEGNRGNVPTDISQLSPDLRWAYDRIQAQRAWDLIGDSGVGLSDVKVAIIDSGLDMFHPDFQSVHAIVIDQTATGTFTDADLGCQPPPPPLLSSCSSHGVAVAGIIGASNEQGLNPSHVDINGILSGVPSLPYEVLMYKNHADIDDVLSAIRGAAIAGVKVINMSFDYFCTSQPATSACIRDLNSIGRDLKMIMETWYGTLFVSIAHNQNRDINQIPPLPLATIKLINHLTVGGTDRNDQRASFSNFGLQVSLAAPAVDVYTTISNIDQLGGYISRGWDKEPGTSFAAPQVSGAAGLLFAINPNLTPDQVKRLLIHSADPIITRDSIGGGRLNVCKAVSSLPLKDLRLGFPCPSQEIYLGTIRMEGTATVNYRPIFPPDSRDQSVSCPDPVTYNVTGLRNLELGVNGSLLSPGPISGSLSLGGETKKVSGPTVQCVITGYQYDQDGNLVGSTTSTATFTPKAASFSGEGHTHQTFAGTTDGTSVPITLEDGSTGTLGIQVTGDEVGLNLTLNQNDFGIPLDTGDNCQPCYSTVPNIAVVGESGTATLEFTRF